MILIGIAAILIGVVMILLLLFSSFLVLALIKPDIVSKLIQGFTGSKH